MSCTSNIQIECSGTATGAHSNTLGLVIGAHRPTNPHPPHTSQTDAHTSNQSSLRHQYSFCRTPLLYAQLLCLDRATLRQQKRPCHTVHLISVISRVSRPPSSAALCHRAAYRARKVGDSSLPSARQARPKPLGEHARQPTLDTQADIRLTQTSKQLDLSLSACLRQTHRIDAGRDTATACSCRLHPNAVDPVVNIYRVRGTVIGRCLACGLTRRSPQPPGRCKSTRASRPAWRGRSRR